MSKPDILQLLQSMQTAGTLVEPGAQLTDQFTITYDMSRSYTISNGVGVMLTAAQTAAAAAAQGIGDGTTAGYATAMLQILNATYSQHFAAFGLQAYTDITSCTLPYVDGNTHYTFRKSGGTWSIKYNNEHSILYGTYVGNVYSSTHSSPENNMIEFPVSQMGLAGVSTNFGQFTLSTGSTLGDPFISPLL